MEKIEHKTDESETKKHHLELKQKSEKLFKISIDWVDQTPVKRV